MNDCEVIVAGAGPTGLVLALWLTLQGVRVRVFDKAERPGTTSRALAVQARTLELYRQAGLAEEVVARGHRTPGVNLWVRGRKVARMPLTEIGKGLSPYPFMLIFPQDQHEALLIERLSALGVNVERQSELIGVEQTHDGVVARLRGPDGGEIACAAAYIAGCDGAHSLVRHAIGAGFAGGSYRQLFYVADIQGSGPPMDGELHLDLDEADFLAVFPLSADGRARLIGTVRDERADRAETLAFDDVSAQAIAHMKLKVDRVNWFSTYRVHHRVADRFAKDRAFIVGDAAHIHSPAGGQGMNTGIGDAINLAWKLAAVVKGRAPAALLDSYETERIGFARRLVATTDRAFTLATAQGALADAARQRLAPPLMSTLLGIRAFRRFAFRTVAQVTLNYRDSPLSAPGGPGRVRAGDRIPWAGPGEADNFAGLEAIGWQVQVYGAAPSELAAWCRAHGLPLRVFDWRPEHEAAGLARDGLYLLRPDSYVAMTASTGAGAGAGAADLLARYFERRNLGGALNTAL